MSNLYIILILESTTKLRLHLDKFFCKKEGFTIDSLVFAFFNDEDLKALNIKFLNHDYYTDVISFDESSKNLIKGNIAISIDRVKDNSNTFSSLFDDELKRVIIHGVLHFMGFNDKTDDEKIFD